MRCFADKKVYLIGLLALLTAGCERATIPPDNTRTGYAYFPLETGTYRLYEGYRINYNFADQNDTLRYQLKELVSSAYLDQQGDSAYVIHKLSRVLPEEQWKLDSIKHIRLNARQLVETGNNKAIIKLVFPVGEGKTWNSNLLTTAEADSFRMVQVHRPFSLDDSLFEQTLTVVQRNISDTIVRQDIRKEVFARHTGPVYRIHKTLNYCATTECIGQGIITSGLMEEIKLIGTGKE